MSGFLPLGTTGIKLTESVHSEAEAVISSPLISDAESVVGGGAPGVGRVPHGIEWASFQTVDGKD
jgi:hypothetical protein